LKGAQREPGREVAVHCARERGGEGGRAVGDIFELRGDGSDEPGAGETLASE
jgi:hypothetical protein